MQLAPTSGEPVKLLHGRINPGYVDSVVEFWAARRCWDVVLIDDLLHVRAAAIRGMNFGGPPWQEVER